MKKSLILLQKINKKILEAAKRALEVFNQAQTNYEENKSKENLTAATEAYKKYQFALQAAKREIELFLTKLIQDYRHLSDLDLLKEADNSINALFKEAKIEFSLFNKKSIEKLELITQIFPVTGEAMSKVVQLYHGIKEIKECGIDTVQESIIRQHIHNVINSLRKNNQQKLVQNLIDLGCFFKVNFPNQNPDELLNIIQDAVHANILPQEPDAKKQIQTNIKTYLRQKTAAHSHVVATLEIALKNELAKSMFYVDKWTINLLKEGIIAFKNLTKIDTENLEVRKQKCDLAQRYIRYATPSNIKKRPSAYRFIHKMRKDCAECLTYLREQLLPIIPTLPNNGSHYLKIQNGTISMQEIDVDQLAEDIANQKMPYRQDISSSLLINAKSYQTVKKLSAILDSEDDPVKKLDDYRSEYNKEETKANLRSNPDSVVMQYCKKIGYYLAVFFTVGIVHAIAKGSPISAQQKLDGKSQSAIKEALCEIKLVR